MNHLSSLHAIVFDYDGVLADTEPLHLRAFQETLAAHGVDLPRDEYFEHYLGLDDEGVFRAVAERLHAAWSNDRVSALVADKAARFAVTVARASAPAGDTGRLAVLYPGVAARVRAWAAAVPLAIASGSLREEILPILEAEGLGSAVPVVVGARDSERGKPFPDPYLRALDLLAAGRDGSLGALVPARCVAIEDSPWGIEAAHAAGMKAVALTTSYPANRLASADAVLAAFEDLTLDFLERLVCSAPPPRP